MRSLKQCAAAAGVLLVTVAAGCNTDPLLTEIKTKKLLVVLKGTYETNSPQPWNMPTLCANYDSTGKCTQYTPEYLSLMQDDSVYECAATEDKLPTSFMVDIAEIRLWDTRGKSYKYANYRQTFASGLNDIDPLFNGIGYPLNNDDIPSKLYPYALLYIRKMLTDGAQTYVARANGWASSPTWDVYREAEFPIYNFNGLQIHSFYDTIRLESTSINRVYPLVVPINDMLTGGVGMVYNGKFSTTVLEIRILVKNYIKKYEQRTSLLTDYGVTHFYALSDWVNDVERGDTVIGGNLHATARTYIPELVGRISGTVPAAAATPGVHVIAIPAASDIRSYTLNRDPYYYSTTTSGTLRSNNPCNLPRAPTQYTGTSIYQALDFFLETEYYKYSWNQKIPGPSNVCSSYSLYTAQWDKFAGLANSFTLPQLAVYVPTQDAGGNATSRQFVIENVMPGTYKVYYANRAPVYGTLYYYYYTDKASDAYVCEFNLLGTVTVSMGSTTAVP
ncbi:MAG: hypothetical protein KA369_18875 [Spirochaetes bacterium]|nr:hypothetical protein [Spirochaetota bacterium]